MRKSVVAAMDGDGVCGMAVLALLNGLRIGAASRRDAQEQDPGQSCRRSLCAKGGIQ